MDEVRKTFTYYNVPSSDADNIVSAPNSGQDGVPREQVSLVEAVPVQNCRIIWTFGICWPRVHGISIHSAVVAEGCYKFYFC